MTLINTQHVRTYDDARTVQLKRVRLSFTDSLKDAKPTVENGTPKHTCNILIESDQPGFDEKKTAVMKAIQAACEQKWKKADKWKSIQEDNPKRIAFRKGERFKNREGEVYQGYAGNMVIAGAGPSAGQKRPKLFSRNKRVLGAPGQDMSFTVDDIPEIFYSGSYADVKVSFYGTDKGGDGVFVTIESIRSLETGERMAGGGAVTTADEFDDTDDGDAFDDDAKTSSDTDEFDIG